MSYMTTVSGTDMYISTIIRPKTTGILHLSGYYQHTESTDRSTFIIYCALRIFKYWVEQMPKTAVKSCVQLSTEGNTGTIHPFSTLTTCMHSMKIQKKRKSHHRDKLHCRIH